MKLRLGRAEARDDLAAVRAVRRRLPDEAALMVDYNQALSVADALARGQALAGEGVYWVEEPIRHDDYVGCASLARALDACSDRREFRRRPGDGRRTGRRSERLRDAGSRAHRRCDGLAARRGSRNGCRSGDVVSSLPRSQRTSAGRDADLSLARICGLGQPYSRRAAERGEGMATAPTRPGTGLVWDDAAVKRFRTT